MRLFTGLDLPAHRTAELDALIASLRPLAAVRWSAAANLHVTTKFIGEWPEARLDELRGALDAVPRPAPFHVSLAGLGWFPNPHQPRIFWLAVKAAPALAELAASLDAALAPLGIAAEPRAYHPHLTLARLGTRDDGPAPDLAPLRRGVAALPSVDFGGFEARAYHLYMSEAGRYTKLASFPFPEAPPDA